MLKAPVSVLGEWHSVQVVSPGAPVCPVGGPLRNLGCPPINARAVSVEIEKITNRHAYAANKVIRTSLVLLMVNFILGSSVDTSAVN